jgi:hypothetical protein
MQRGLISGNRPDLTPVQLIAGVPIIAELLHTFGVYDLSQAQQDSLGKAVTFCFGLLGADAAVRIGRNLKDAKVESMALAQPGEAPVGPTYPSQSGPPAATQPQAEYEPTDAAPQEAYGGEGAEGTLDAPGEGPLDPEEIADIEYDDPELAEDPDLDEDLGPIGDAEALDDGEA